MLKFKLTHYQTVKCIIVSVPWLWKQGPWKGNINETHIQFDLTEDIMAERYPELKLLHKTKNIGSYICQKP